MKSQSLQKSFSSFKLAIIIFLIVFSPDLPANIQTGNDISLKIISPSKRRALELTGTGGTTITGSVIPPEARVTINGQQALIDIDGVFICHTKIQLSGEKPDSGMLKGKFTFNISAGQNIKTIEETYLVKLPMRTSDSDTLYIDKNWEVTPSANVLLKSGESFQIEFKATPGCKGFFNVEGTGDTLPLVETSFINSSYWGQAVFGSGFTDKGDTIRGIYKGNYIVPGTLKNAGISVTLKDPRLGSKNFTLPGRISTIDSRFAQIARIKNDPNLTIGRTSPGGGYQLFLPEGVELEITGREGNWLKTKLAGNESVFIPASSAVIMPSGTPPPKSSIRIIRTKDDEKYTSVDLALSERVPYKIKQYEDPQRIELFVYNTTSDIDWVFYDRSSNFIKEIKPSQAEEGILKVEIFLKQKTHWGYHAEYEANILRLRINKPARRNGGFLFWSNQLKGRIISIDPGHTADNGAVGPRGTKEKDVNFEISLKLKKMLEDAGALAYLTHEKDQDLPLLDRKARVNSFKPEISVSMHNNAVPEGVNPVEHNGSSVYYYYPQALPLAKLIHKNLIENLKLKDFGLYWDNLYMCRIPEAVSLLVEPAFMMMPEQERLLRTGDFQEKIARSVFDAIETFYKEYTQ